MSTRIFTLTILLFGLAGPAAAEPPAAPIVDMPESIFDPMLGMPDASEAREGASSPRESLAIACPVCMTLVEERESELGRALTTPELATMVISPQFRAAVVQRMGADQGPSAPDVR